MELDKLTKAFGNKTIPTLLKELLQFDNTIAKDDYFSEGFEFYADEENYMLKTYCEDETFLNSFVAFAQADGTGSNYAFWTSNQSSNLENAPIVAFGSEGGYHIIAENIGDFLQILTYDAEPMIDWDDAYYYKDEEDYEASTHREAYRKWLNDNHQISATNNADELVEKAQKKYQQEFKDWMSKYHSEE